MGDRVLLSAGILLSATFAWMALSAPPRAAPLAPLLSAESQEREDYNSGAYLYRVFCASCHGESGKGDGPVADLTDPPASDLTTIRGRAGGVFPRAQVMAVLDRTTSVKGHETMPNWRTVLRRTEGEDERVIRKRLEALVSHVETLQNRE
jgi:mono/diheme cytochrome c family protein